MRGFSNIKVKPLILKAFSGNLTITRLLQKEIGSLIFSKLIAFSHCGKFDSFHQDLDSTTDHWGTNVM
jgi:hypothetical protein